MKKAIGSIIFITAMFIALYAFSAGWNGEPKEYYLYLGTADSGVTTEANGAKIISN